MIAVLDLVEALLFCQPQGLFWIICEKLPEHFHANERNDYLTALDSHVSEIALFGVSGEESASYRQSHTWNIC